VAQLKKGEKNGFWWTFRMDSLACCEWRAAAPGLKPLRLPRAPTAKISNKFSREAYTYQTPFLGNAQHFKQGFS